MRKKKIIFIILVIFILLVLVSSLSIIIDRIIYEREDSKKIDEITASSVEVERKWIIDKEKIPYDLSKYQTVELEQSYINFSPEIRVRKVNIDAGVNEYFFAAKTYLKTNGMTRAEMEYPITEEEFNTLISKKEGKTVYKTRYKVRDREQWMDIDIYKGDLEGLAYLEIEFENEKEARSFEVPSWVIKEVTNELEYKNGNLARYGIPSSYYEYTK